MDRSASSSAVCSAADVKKDRDAAKKKRAAMAFIENRLDDTAELKLKIILLGSSGVGKTSLLNKFLDETADVDQVQLTVLCDFSHCAMRLAGKTVQLRMWDIGGMERFDAMNRASNFYRNAHGAMLVFSVTDLASFQALPSWLDRARTFVGSSGEGREFECCLVGNKADEAGRMVSQREAQRFANQLGLTYIETSALNVVNVQKAFVDLALAVVRTTTTAEAQRAQTVLKSQVKDAQSKQKKNKWSTAKTDDNDQGRRDRRGRICACS